MNWTTNNQYLCDKTFFPHILTPRSLVRLLLWYEKWVILQAISGTCFHLSKISGICFHLSEITISLRFWKLDLGNISLRFLKTCFHLSKISETCFHLSLRLYFSKILNTPEQSSHVLVHENDQLECSSRSKNMTSNLHLFFRPDSTNFPLLASRESDLMSTGYQRLR